MNWTESSEKWDRFTPLVGFSTAVIKDTRGIVVSVPNAEVFTTDKGTTSFFDIRRPYDAAIGGLFLADTSTIRRRRDRNHGFAEETG